MTALAVAACTVESPTAARSDDALHVAASGSRTVTLITGDRVTIGDGEPVVAPARGRRDVRFLVAHDGDHVLVIPSDAAPLIARGQLELALFDVTRLLAYGYGDDQRADLPLIVSGGTASGFAPQLAGLTAKAALRGTRAMVIRQPKATASLAQLTAPAFTGGAPVKIWLSHKRKPLLDHSVPQIGADVAQARGLGGAGVVVAVVDTGIDTSHPDLAGQVLDGRNFTDDGGDAGDVLGHGTHVASILAGTGAASGGRFRGVAPDAKLLDARACTAIDCPDDAIATALEWAAVEQHAPIVSMSLGEADTAGVDFLEAQIDRLSAETGTLFVVAAGNAGLDDSVESPSTADAALSVAAVDRDDHLAVFSSRGPRLEDGAVKPEIAAPGVEIVAARARGVDPIGSPIGSDYMSLSGTSMATPHVSGAAALLLQQHPGWTGAQLKAELVATAKQLPEGVTAVGAGRVDIDRGTREVVVPDAATVDLGRIPFPHGADPPIVRTLGYRNTGTTAVTLAVSATLASETGAPGSVRVAPASLTIAAGGAASVAITVETRGTMPDGDYTGLITARGDGVQVATPLSVRREAEAYDVTFRAIDEAGAPATAFLLLVRGRDARFDEVAPETTIHLAAGTYGGDASLDAADGLGAYLALPRLEVRADAVVELDARLARKPHVTVAGPPRVVLGSTVRFKDDVTGRGGGISGFGLFGFGQIGADLPADELRSSATLTLGDRVDPTEVTLLAHVEHGHIVRDWNEAVRDDQLATVIADHASTGNDEASKGATAYDAEDHQLGGSLIVERRTPFPVIERLDARVRWLSQLSTFDSQFLTPFTSVQLRRYEGGHVYVEHWNRAPLGPAFPERLRLSFFGDIDPGGSAVREGDTLRVQPTLFAAQGTRDDSSFVRAQRITLSRGDQVVADVTTAFDIPQPFPAVEMPAAAATYRLAATATLFALPTALSNTVSATWTFRSARGDGALPLPVVRFEPALDEHNTSHARVIAMPLRVERPARAPRPPITELRVEASFDDGASWTRVPVLGAERAIAVIAHPAGAEAVSLRATAADAQGNRVEQQIIRAYRLAP